MTTHQISILGHHIDLGIKPPISLISDLGPQRLTESPTMLQSQVNPVDISTIHVVPEVDTHDCGHSQGWTEESGCFVVVHASLSVDVVTRLAPCSVVKWRTSAWWGGAPRVTSPVQILRLVLLPVTQISLKVTTQQRSCKSKIVIIPSELMSIHVKKIYIFSNAKASLWQLRTVYNNHLLKVQGWGEWTLMRVWSVSYRFHPIDWCHPRQCLHGSLFLGHPQTQCYRPNLQILLLDL